MMLRIRQPAGALYRCAYFATVGAPAPPFSVGFQMIARIKPLTLLLLLGLISVPAGSFAEPQVQWDHAESGCRDIELLGSKYLIPRNLKDYYHDLRRQNHSEDKMLMIFVFTGSEGAGSRAALWYPTPATTYKDWSDRYRTERARGPQRNTRLIAIGQDAVIQTSHGKTASSEVLSGSDPTVFGVGGTKCQILEFSCYHLPRSIREDETNPTIFHVYLKANPLPNEERAKAIVRELQNRLSHLTLRVSIREDSWFIFSFRFPLWFPFAEDTPPPTEDQYFASHRVYCSSDTSQIQCR